MRVRKSESHRALLLPVLLILAAAFLATSLTGMGDNDVSGAQVYGPTNCEWVASPEGTTTGQKSVSVECTSNRPNVYAGGCNTYGSSFPLLWSYPRLKDSHRQYPEVWSCGQQTNPHSTGEFRAYALCCREKTL